MPWLEVLCLMSDGSDEDATHSLFCYAYVPPVPRPPDLNSPDLPVEYQLQPKGSLWTALRA